MDAPGRSWWLLLVESRQAEMETGPLQKDLFMFFLATV
jgi:hypothetical protein